MDSIEVKVSYTEKREPHTVVIYSINWKPPTSKELQNWVNEVRAKQESKHGD